MFLLTRFLCQIRYECAHFPIPQDFQFSIQNKFCFQSLLSVYKFHTRVRISFELKIRMNHNICLSLSLAHEFPRNFIRNGR